MKQFDKRCVRCSGDQQRGRRCEDGEGDREVDAAHRLRKLLETVK